MHVEYILLTDLVYIRTGSWEDTVMVAAKKTDAEGENLVSPGAAGSGADGR